MVKKKEEVGEVASVATEDTSSLSEKLDLLFASVEALSQRLDSLEGSATDKAVGEEVIDTRTAPRDKFEVAAEKFQQLQVKRAEMMEKSNRYPKVKSDQSDIALRLQGLTGQTLASVHSMLQNMRIQGKIASYIVLPVGVPGPSDVNERRVIVSVDSTGNVLSAHLG